MLLWWGSGGGVGGSLCPPQKQTSVRFGDFGLFERITFKLGMLLYFDPRTYKGGEGGSGGCHTPKVFPICS